MAFFLFLFLFCLEFLGAIYIFHHLELEINAFVSNVNSPPPIYKLLLYMAKELISESTIQTLAKPAIGITIQINVPYEH